MHGHSFERIWTIFDTWHPYTLRMVKDRLASAARARAPLAPAHSRSARRLYTPLQMGGELRLGISQLAGGRRNGPSAAGARSNRAP